MEIVTYILIILLLVLVGVSGLQFSYTFYVDRLNRMRQKHIRELERRCVLLRQQLEDAEQMLAERDAHIGRLFSESVTDDDVWAEVIDVESR